MDALTKIQGRIKRQQDREFKALFKTVRSKIRRFKLSRASKKKVIADLSNCNNIDLMNVLSVDDGIKTIKDYLFAVNSFLELEYKTFREQGFPVFNIGDMDRITKDIAARYKRLSMKEDLRRLVYGKGNKEH